MKVLRRKVESQISLLVLAMGTFVAGGGRYVRAEANADPSDGASEPADRSQWALKESGQAIAQARKILGLPEAKTDGLSASLVTLQEDNTPYLSDQLIGRPLWHVVVRDWSLELASSPPGFTDKYVRTFDVYLDPISAQVLKLRSRWPKGEAPMAPEPSAASAAKQMQAGGGETYHGFPTDAPKATFLDALDGMQRGGGNPLIAKQIVAQYVIRSVGGTDPQASVGNHTTRGPRGQGSAGRPAECTV